MKVIFVLNDQKSISNFIYILKVLHGNSTEVCLAFSKTGISLSQSWDKRFTDMSDTAKYLFFIEALQFAKITCQNSNNCRVRLNIKEAFTKLKGLKKELREVSISVTNETKCKETSQDFCLFEIVADLFTHGTVIYRTGCRLEQVSKEFLPVKYYDYLQSEKSLLLAAEPEKLRFLKDFKNDFIELFLKEKRVELYGNSKPRKITINPHTCFLTYNHDKLAEIVKENESVMLPPNHILRYREVCEKWNKNITIHIENSVPFQGFLKLFCSVKIDRNFFILKLKTKLHEKISIVQSQPNVRPVSSQTEIRSSMMHAQSMRNFSTGTCQKDTRGSTFPFSIEENMIQGFNSVPNERIFNHMGERFDQSQNLIIRKKKSPFMFSQEGEGIKRVKLSVPTSQDDQITPPIILSKKLEKPVPKVRSILDSPEKIQEIVMKKESQETRESRKLFEIEEIKNGSSRDSSGKRVIVHKSDNNAEKKKKEKEGQAEASLESPGSPFFKKKYFDFKAKKNIMINWTNEGDKQKKADDLNDAGGQKEEKKDPEREMTAEQVSIVNKNFVDALHDITMAMRAFAKP